MATFEELFAKPKATGNYMKWDNPGDSLAVELLEEPNPKAPQMNRQTDKRKFLVQEKAGGAWKPMDEGSFNPDEVEGSFLATQIEVKVKVYQKSTKAGKVEDFEPFETVWELSREHTDKLKEEMAETGISFGPGTKANIKYVLDGKPRKFSIKLKPAE